VKHKYHVGEIVDVNGTEGVVLDIAGWQCTYDYLVEPLDKASTSLQVFETGQGWVFQSYIKGVSK
jgi:hypothetical protein